MGIIDKIKEAVSPVVFSAQPKRVTWRHKRGYRAFEPADRGVMLRYYNSKPPDAFEVDSEAEASGAARQLWGSPVAYVAEPIFTGYRRPVISGRMRRITPKTPRLRR